MKFYNYYIFLTCIFSFSIYCQEKNKSGDYEIALTYGNTKIEINDKKSVGFFSGAKFKKEFFFNKNYSIVSGLDFQNFFFNSDNFHLEHKNFGLPISLRAKSNLNNDTFYCEIGIYTYFMYNLKTYDNTTSSELEIRNLGYSSGYFFKLGYKHNLNDRFAINLCLLNGQDFSNSIRTNKPNIKVENQVGLEFGVAFKI